MDIRSNDAPPLVVHMCHHKTGTTWFRRILADVAENFGMKFVLDGSGVVPPRTDLFMDMHGSRQKLDGIESTLIGSHMIRDPRDVVISGLHYHRHAKEEWLHRPNPDYDGKTYQEKLNSLDDEAALTFEMEECGARTIGPIIRWNYQDPRILELRYEAVIADPDEWFPRIFRHWGFLDEHLPKLLAIADANSFQALTKRKLGEVQEKSHLRSGKSGQWRDEFSASHCERFKQLFGTSLIDLGYEADNTW